MLPGWWESFCLILTTLMYEDGTVAQVRHASTGVALAARLLVLLMELFLDSLGPADVFLASVDVELDSPGPSSVIKSVLLRARAGTAKIHAPRALQVCMSIQNVFH